MLNYRLMCIKIGVVGVSLRCTGPTFVVPVCHSDSVVQVWVVLVGCFNLFF